MVTIKLKEEFGTAYIAPHHSLQLDRILKERDNIDLAGCFIAKDAMKDIDLALAAGKNIFDSKNEERENLLSQARAKAKLETSTAVELPKLEEIKLFAEYVKSLDPKVEYCVKESYSNQYLYPLLTLLNIYRPSIVVQISEKYYELALYIMKTLYKRGCKSVFDSTKEFVVITQEHSYELTFTTESESEQMYVYGYGEISFEQLTAKAIVLPAYFGKIALSKDPKLNELWKDVKEVATKNLDRYFHTRRETIKSFLGGS